jgi:hypothetical protein
MKTLLSAVVLVLASVSLCGAEEGDGFVALFNGKDLTGWTQRGGTADYMIEGDEIVGTSKLHTDNSFLCTAKDYGDFVLEVDVKVDDRLNSGIQIRSLCNDEKQELELPLADGAISKITIPAKRVHGYQVEIDPSTRSWSGGIYDEARRGWLYNLEGDKHTAARAAFKRGEWNHYTIEAQGDHLSTSVNGVPVAHLHDDLTLSGFIALQVHSIGGDESKEGAAVRWKNIRIKELK